MSIYKLITVFVFLIHIKMIKMGLIWLDGPSRLQIIAGVGVPLDLKPENVIVGTVIKANYVLPKNASQITNPFVFYQRKKRSASRWDIYSLLAQTIESRGFEGKACVLRAICEVAQTPFDKNNGLFHEIVHRIFTPTSTNEVIQYYSDNEYYAAQIIGEKNGNCENIFKDCKSSILDEFTLNL